MRGLFVVSLAALIAAGPNASATFLKAIEKHTEFGHHVAAHHQKSKEASKRYHPVQELCPFGYGKDCGGGGAPLTQATKDEVANILKGIISNLGKRKGLTQISAEMIKTYGIHEAKNAETKKALVGLLSAFAKDQKATIEVVKKLTGEPQKNLASLAAVSRALSKMAPLQEPKKPQARAKWQPLTTDKLSAKAPPRGTGATIVKK
jgi:hypothetical protein